MSFLVQLKHEFCQSCNLWFGVFKRWRERRSMRMGEKSLRNSRFCDMCSVKHDHKYHLKMWTFWYVMCFLFFLQHSSLAPLPTSKTEDLKESWRERVKMHIYSRWVWEFRTKCLTPALPNQRHPCHTNITDKCPLTSLLSLLHYISESLFKDLFPLIVHSLPGSTSLCPILFFWYYYSFS